MFIKLKTHDNAFNYDAQYNARLLA